MRLYADYRNRSKHFFTGSQPAFSGRPRGDADKTLIPRRPEGDR